MKSEIGILYLNSFNKDALMKIIKSKSLTFTELFTAKPHVFVSTDHPLADKKIRYNGGACRLSVSLV